MNVSMHNVLNIYLTVKQCNLTKVIKEEKMG